MKIENYMEIIIDEKIDEIIGNMDICTCPRCRADIMALTLNSLPPKHIVTHKGGLYIKLESHQTQFEVSVIAEIVKAATIVSANPNH